MLSRITEHIHTALESTDYFDTIFPFVEKIKRDGKEFPAMYCQDGQYKSVNNFDSYYGVAYIRQTGKQRFSNVTEQPKMPACDLLLSIETPLRIVVCIPKKKLSVDDAFSKERVSTTLIKALTGQGGLIKQELKANDYLSLPQNVDTDARSVLNEEYSGLEKMQDINYNYCYCAIDLNITIKIKASCITTECQMEYYG